MLVYRIAIKGRITSALSSNMRWLRCLCLAAELLMDFLQVVKHAILMKFMLAFHVKSKPRFRDTQIILRGCFRFQSLYSCKCMMWFTLRGYNIAMRPRLNKVYCWDWPSYKCCHNFVMDSLLKSVSIYRIARLHFCASKILWIAVKRHSADNISVN